jgi:hypothetical protein
VLYGEAVQLSGAARGVRGVTLEQRTGSGAWEPGPAVAPAADGSFSVMVNPLATTRYRLTVGDASTPTVRLAVVPIVTLELTPTGLAGTIEPARPGVIVKLQANETAGPAPSARSDAAGAFVFATLPASGSYRATALGGASEPVLVP